MFQAKKRNFKKVYFLWRMYYSMKDYKYFFLLKLEDFISFPPNNILRNAWMKRLKMSVIGKGISCKFT